jgi:hypothetical protein
LPIHLACFSQWCSTIWSFQRLQQSERKVLPEKQHWPCNSLACTPHCLTRQRVTCQKDMSFGCCSFLRPHVCEKMGDGWHFLLVRTMLCRAVLCCAVTRAGSVAPSA